MVMGGAIMKLNFRSQLLMKLGSAFKSIVPYIWIYKLFAFIIMPYKNHKESRLLFINEAKKLYQKEFKNADVEIIGLPSTSPAHAALSPAVKLDAWCAALSKK